MAQPEVHNEVNAFAIHLPFPLSVETSGAPSDKGVDEITTTMQTQSQVKDEHKQTINMTPNQEGGTDVHMKEHLVDRSTELSPEGTMVEEVVEAAADEKHDAIGSQDSHNDSKQEQGVRYSDKHEDGVEEEIARARQERDKVLAEYHEFFSKSGHLDHGTNSEDSPTNAPTHLSLSAAGHMSDDDNDNKTDNESTDQEPDAQSRPRWRTRWRVKMALLLSFPLILILLARWLLWPEVQAPWDVPQQHCPLSSSFLLIPPGPAFYKPTPTIPHFSSSNDPIPLPRVPVPGGQLSYPYRYLLDIKTKVADLETSLILAAENNPPFGVRDMINETAVAEAFMPIVWSDMDLVASDLYMALQFVSYVLGRPSKTPIAVLRQQVPMLHEHIIARLDMLESRIAILHQHANTLVAICDMITRFSELRQRLPWWRKHATSFMKSEPSTVILRHHAIRVLVAVRKLHAFIRLTKEKSSILCQGTLVILREVKNASPSAPGSQGMGWSPDVSSAWDDIKASWALAL